MADIPAYFVVNLTVVDAAVYRQCNDSWGKRFGLVSPSIRNCLQGAGNFASSLV
jgi:hypothetical protein